MNITTVKEARQAGFKVRVGHFRIPDLFFPLSKKEFDSGQFQVLASDESWDFLEMSPLGGKTVVEISKDEKDCFGVAYCSQEDNYCKKEGVKRALERSLEVWSSL